MQVKNTTTQNKMHGSPIVLVQMFKAPINEHVVTFTVAMNSVLPIKYAIDLVKFAQDNENKLRYEYDNPTKFIDRRLGVNDA